MPALELTGRVYNSRQMLYEEKLTTTTRSATELMVICFGQGLNAFVFLLLLFFMIFVLQSQFYTKLMPAVFQSLQDMDERRVKCLQTFMRKSAQTEQDVLPIISQCLEGVQRCTDSIDEKEVSRQIKNKYSFLFTNN